MVDTTKVKECCKNLIALCEDYENIENKGMANDILIDMDLNKEELIKGLV